MSQFSEILAEGSDPEDQGGAFPTGIESNKQSPGSVQVDAKTAKRLGIEVEPVTRHELASGIRTTGQIESLPNQKVEVTAPIDGTVVELLVRPGAKVTKGQTIAVLSSPELAQLRVDSVKNLAEAEPGLQQAQADLRLAQQNYERQRLQTAADLKQAQIQLAVAQEKSDRDRELVAAGALARRPMLESQTQLAEAKATFTKAESRLPVLEARDQLKRAQAAVEVAQSKVRLSNAAYQARLQQLGISANAKGLVSVAAPISGTVADRQITLGETISLQAGSKPLMTILNNSSVWATANIYEAELESVKLGQQVQVKVQSLPNQTFTGRIALIGTVVDEKARVVPVKAALDNSSGLLKPGMFAELEILTEHPLTSSLVIPSSAVVEANGKKLVYVQHGDSYQPAEVTLGQALGNLVEVKSGLFSRELIVAQRPLLVYAQSLRGGNKAQGADAKDSESQAREPDLEDRLPVPKWLAVAIGGTIVAVGAFWIGRCTQSRKMPRPESEVSDYEANGYSPCSTPSSTRLIEERERSQPSHED